MTGHSRGQYKTYLKDINQDIPRTTAWRRKRAWEAENVTGSDHSDVENEADEYGSLFTEKDEVLHADDQFPGGNEGIYVGSSVTRSQALTLTVAFSMRHQLSLRARRDLIDLLNSFVPNMLPQSNYLLNKVLFNDTLYSIYQRHVYCSLCQNYLGNNVSKNFCIYCKINVDFEKSYAEGNYFLVLPLQPQIKDLFESTNLFNLLKKTNNAEGRISQVSDGDVYRNVVSTAVPDDNFCTLSWSCDGVPIFKSCNLSMWPLYCAFNELPLAVKRNYNLVTALWFGSSKPRMDTFLKLFVEESQKLLSEGITWYRNDVPVTTKIIIVNCICDAPARALVQNFSQFNGAFGCGFCKQEGNVMQKGRGHARVYPVESDMLIERTNEETVRDAEVATETGKRECGVIGPSIVMLIPHFDIIKGFIPDYMHCVLLGVVRYFAFLWFEPSNRNKSYFISEISLFDQELLSLRPPKEIRRLPRSIVQRKFWKAAEWRSFLLFYCPLLLTKHFEVKFYKHWMLLVFSLHVLLLDEISVSDLNKAKLAITKFCTLVQELYGIEHMTYNVHILLHLCESVKNWGPLQFNSAFLFEDTSGCLLKMFSGTRYAPDQIIKFYISLRNLNKVSAAWMSGASDELCELYGRLTDSSIPLYTQSARKVDDVVLLGAYVLKNVVPELQETISNFLPYKVYSWNCEHYNRMIVKGHLHTTFEYSNSFKSDNSVCKMISGSICRIISIIVLKICTCSGACSCCGDKEVLVCIVKKFLPSQKLFRCIDSYVGDNIYRFFAKFKLDDFESVEFGSSIIEKQFCHAVQNEYTIIHMPQFELD